MDFKQIVCKIYQQKNRLMFFVSPLYRESFKFYSERQISENWVILVKA